jgi:hypothetical protein
MAQMKYWQALRYLTFISFAGIGFTAPTVAHATCTGGATLSGYYGMEVNGQVPAGYGKFLNGVVYFNGTCALQVTATVGENQTVNSFATFLGTYNTNPDNTITITFTPPGASAPETYNVAFSPIFNEAVGIETDPSAIASIDLKAQIYPTSGNHNVYNNASLKGTWAAMCSGAMGSYSDLNYVTFDGSTSVYGVFGNVTGINDSNDLDSFGANSVAGPYGVNSNGTFGGYVVVGTTTAGFSGVIDNNLNEIQYNLSTAGSTGYDVESCTAKRVK